MSPGRGRKRKFHQVGCLLFFFSTLADILTSLQSYRPPTPPLPAVNKEQLPLDDEIELPKPGNPVRVSVTLLWHAINLACRHSLLALRAHNLIYRDQVSPKPITYPCRLTPRS